MDRERQKYFYGKGYSDGMKEGKIQNLEYMVKMRQSILTLQAELKKARGPVVKCDECENSPRGCKKCCYYWTSSFKQKVDEVVRNV